MSQSDAPSDPIPTNLRLLKILEEVARRGASVRPSDLVEVLGLPKPTVHRLLQTAEAEGYLQRDLDGRAYGIGARLRGLAVDTLAAKHLRLARYAILKAVSEEIGETCNLATADRDGMTYLERVETTWPLRIQLPVGTKVPFHCTASGKLYLSTLPQKLLAGFLTAGPLDRKTAKTLTDAEALHRELERTAQRGFATDDEEFMEGMSAVAVPVPDQKGRLLATLSVHAPIQRFDVTQLTATLDVLSRGAEKLTALLTD